MPQGRTKIFLVEMMFKVLSEMTSAKQINSTLLFRNLRPMNGIQHLHELKKVVRKASSVKSSKSLTRANARKLPECSDSRARTSKAHAHAVRQFRRTKKWRRRCQDSKQRWGSEKLKRRRFMARLKRSMRSSRITHLLRIRSLKLVK